MIKSDTEVSEQRTEDAKDLITEAETSTRVSEQRIENLKTIADSNKTATEQGTKEFSKDIHAIAESNSTASEQRMEKMDEGPTTSAPSNVDILPADDSSIQQKAQILASGLKDWIVDSAIHARDDSIGFANEVIEECVPTINSGDIAANLKYFLANFIHVPYFPAFHRPGWMVRYFVGPYDAEWREMIIADLSAGITVGMLLIPQGLSYASLANLPPIVGLYSSIIPSAVYIFFGSSLQLAVGPVALLSLLCGEIVIKYVPDYLVNPQKAIACAGQASFCCGIVLAGMALLNLGYLINFMSHPVMSGFTTGAAMIIGANQLKSAFGFSVSVPQQGQPNYEYNWEVFSWYTINWNGKYDYDYLPKLSSKQKFQNHRWYRNFIATRICFGLYCPLMMLMFFKNSLKSTEERRKTFWFKALLLILNMFPFIALVIGTHIAWGVKHDDHYADTKKLYVHNYYANALKVVGSIKAGVNILRHPVLPFPLGPFFVDCIPLTLIAYMEGYAVARRIAAQRNELHILNASQEMWAIGVANLVATVGTGYPVSGSFSRSALNHLCGARTPLSKVTSMCVILLVLGVLTQTLHYVPYSALAAIIFQAIYSLLSFSDFWNAWKHSKKDFFVMFVTMAVVVIWNTDVALAAGIGMSVLAFQFDSRTSKNTDPVLAKSHAIDGEGIDIVVINSDLNFINASRIKDFVTLLTLKTPVPPDPSSRQLIMAKSIGDVFDSVLTPFPPATVDVLPKAIVIDMTVVRTYDITGLEAIAEAMHETRLKGVLVVITNLFPALVEVLKRFGIKSDSSIPGLDLEVYTATAPLDRRPAKLQPQEVPVVENDIEDPTTDAAMRSVATGCTPSQWSLGSYLPDMPAAGVNPSTYFSLPESEKK